jgi:hypothetical protein
MKKSRYLVILIVLMALSACSALRPTPAPSVSETLVPLPTLAKDSHPNILGKWIIEKTQSLNVRRYFSSIKIGDEGDLIEFTGDTLIYDDAVAYDYKWVDDRRIKLAVNIALTGNVWMVYTVKLEGDKLLLLDGRDESVLSTFSRWTGTKPPIQTKTPAPTSTEGAMGEFQLDIDAIAALDYSRADWQEASHVLEHRNLSGCTLAADGGTDAFDPNSSGDVIGGFTWLGGEGAYSLKLGDVRIIGNLVARYGGKPSNCRQAIESLLKSVHAMRDYAQAGECRYAPKQRLIVGGAATLRSSSYLRTEPRWAEDTRIRLVGPAEKLTLQITGGPICAIYDKGEYSYWQVELSNGEKGWMAEGDLKEYYLVPKR